MDSKIKGSFWLDDDIGELSAHMKLVALWVMSNPQVNILGVTKFSARSFVFETGLPVEALAGLCAALPRAFVFREGLVLARNYVLHQFGSGSAFRSNNTFVSAKRTLGQIKQAWLRDLITQSCPELLDEPLGKSPSPVKPLQGQREREGDIESATETGKGGAGEKHFSESVTDDLVLKFLSGWPGELSSATPQIDRESAKLLLAKLNARASWPVNWRRYLVSIWRAEWRTLAESGRPAYQKKTGARSADVVSIDNQKKTTALSAEEDNLAFEINALRANNLEAPKEKLDRWAVVKAEIKKLQGGGV